VQGPGGVGVEGGDGLLDARARAGDLRGDGLLLGDDARELLEAPLVGLVEVDRGAEEVARPQRVALAACGVGLRCLRRELVAQEGREAGVGLARCRGAALELGADEPVTYDVKNDVAGSASSVACSIASRTWRTAATWPRDAARRSDSM
jgi:hypothetical protein